MMSRFLPIGHSKLNCRYSGIALYSIFVPLIIKSFLNSDRVNFIISASIKYILGTSVFLSHLNTIYSSYIEGSGIPSDSTVFIHCCGLCSLGFRNQSKFSIHRLFTRPFRIKFSPFSSVRIVIPNWKTLRLLFKIQQKPFPLFKGLRYSNYLNLSSLKSFFFFSVYFLFFPSSSVMLFYCVSFMISLQLSILCYVFGCWHSSSHQSL